MLPPAATGFGDAELVVKMSACVASATTSAAVALLLAELGSLTAELTVTVSLTAVPAAAPAVTLTTNVMVAGAPGERVESVQMSVARVQVQPAGPVSETAVVFAGRTSVRVTVVAALGPLFVTTCVYVMLLFASTGTGLPEFVTERSAEPATSRFTVALLFVLVGSPVVDVTESVCVMVVPAATLLFTFTTKVKFAVAAAAIVVVSVQVSVPRTQVHPAGPVNDTADVFAGSVSVNAGAFAVAGPLLVTLCV